MRWIVSLMGGIILASLFAGSVAAQSPATWVRGYPQRAANGCVEYVAQWSDGTYTATPWDCGGGVATMGSLTASRGYPQIAANGCTEYVTQWSDGSYTWVPFECPPGVIYYKPSSTPPAGGNTLPALPPANPGTPTLPVLPPANPDTPTLPPAARPGDPIPSPVVPGWRQYTQSGFSISVPGNWQSFDVRELGLEGRPAEYVNLFKFAAADNQDDALLVVLKGLQRGDDSLLAILERNSSGGGSGGSSRVVSRQEVTLPAGRALRLVVEFTTSRGEALKSVEYLVLVGDQAYILDFTTTAEMFPRFEPIFDQIAQTLRQP